MLSEKILNEVDKMYQRLGEETIRKLVTEFYTIMDTDNYAKSIRNMHSKDLSKPKRKLEMYLIGRFGGPPLYVREYGHPRLKARHFPFKIGEREKEEWMYCMNKALNSVIANERDREVLRKFFDHLSDFMINQPIE